MAGIRDTLDGLFDWGPLGSTGFRIHLAVYVLVNLLLLAINLLTTPDRLWFYWPLLGWGLGVIGHAVAEHYTGGRQSRVRSIAKGARR